MTSESELLERDDAVISDAMKIRFFPFGMASQDGSTLTGVDGEELIDFNASWAVANTGYRHPVVRERVENQLREATANSPLSIPQEPVVRLAERLRDLTPMEFPTKVWFGHSGSEAGDLLSKAIPAKGDGDTVVTFEGSYHGITAGAASISGHGALDGFASEDVVTLPFPNRFRADCSPGELTERALDRVSEAFEANDVAGLITEPLQSDGGVLVPPPGFLDGLADLCADHDAYFVVDEVKAGLGRTGELFAFEHADVVPDAIMLGKPLGSGLPISAVVGRAELVDFEPAGHMMTTAASPLPVAAALGTLDVIEREELPRRAARLGDRLAERLRDVAADSPVVGDVRGRGLMHGLEIVTEDGLDPAPTLTATISLWAREHGLVQFYVGTESNVLEITPPLTISKSTLDEGCARLAAAIEDSRSGPPAEALLEQYAGW
ncbi:aspartate aminotransferase family protein [Halorussus litoreus]|uniref:aspartate aminotransferase family protein n=1 Tax=Halorussus litoreus TaxID=1710536 RepID=UPI0013007C13|nr:aspartate aminotransferase family protein [Halorussus litoreus]